MSATRDSGQRQSDNKPTVHWSILLTNTEREGRIILLLPSTSSVWLAMNVKTAILLLSALLFLRVLYQLSSPTGGTRNTRLFKNSPTKLITMGIEKEILKEGTGPKPRPGQTVTVHCTGFGKNGDLSQKFWSTKDPGQKPFAFIIGKKTVILGWDEGVLGMNLGESARLKCSPDYAYGQQGFQAWGINPNSELIFEIEVLEIK